MAVPVDAEVVGVDEPAEEVGEVGTEFDTGGFVEETLEFGIKAATVFDVFADLGVFVGFGDVKDGIEVGGRSIGDRRRVIGYGRGLRFDVRRRGRRTGIRFQANGRREVFEVDVFDDTMVGGMSGVGGRVVMCVRATDELGANRLVSDIRTCYKDVVVFGHSWSWLGRSR